MQTWNGFLHTTKCNPHVRWFCTALYRTGSGERSCTFRVPGARAIAYGEVEFTRKDYGKKDDEIGLD